MPCGRKRKRHKIATHKRKKRLRKQRHKKKSRQCVIPLPAVYLVNGRQNKDMENEDIYVS